MPPRGVHPAHGAFEDMSPSREQLEFAAQRLREANEEGKLERAAAEKERREQELAAVRIQALNRGKQGKARTAQIKANNGIFVREL